MHLSPALVFLIQALLLIVVPFALWWAAGVGEAVGEAVGLHHILGAFLTGIFFTLTGLKVTVTAGRRHPVACRFFRPGADGGNGHRPDPAAHATGRPAYGR